jgi:hypothetical protein
MSALPAGVHRLDAETYHGDKLSPEPAASLAPERFDDCPPRLNVRPGRRLPWPNWPHSASRP